MSIELLKKVRLIAPGIIMFLFAVILGAATKWWKLELPDFEKAMYAPSLILPGLLYYITPLRKWVNQPHHNRLVEYIRAELVAAAEVDDRPEKYSWRALKPFFFNKIDNDESLKTQSKLAYFNGSVWTTFADITALSIIYILLSISIWFIFNNDGAIFSAIVFFVFSVIGLLGSFSTTKKQMEIAKDQVDYIEFKYKSDLEKRIAELDR